MNTPLVVVSNRLPLVLEHGAAGWHAEPAVGGLVSAMSPVLQRRGGTWVGWPGNVKADEGSLVQALDRLAAGLGYRCAPVALSPNEVQGFYHGFANQVLWPLFHDMLSRCNFESRYWRSFLKVNHKFARVVADRIGVDTPVWVHDYHLMALGRALREAGVEGWLGFFLHIPFPSPDLFVKLPWRHELLEAMLAFDLIGFQTCGDRDNFVGCLRALYRQIDVRERTGATQRVRIVDPRLADGERVFSVGSFPISIDCQTLERQAVGAEVEAILTGLRADFGRQRIILGVDRLDYTKGLPNKLRAFQTALRRYPELSGQVTLVQHVVPSRETIPEYHRLHLEIEQRVSEINGEFGQPGWLPVQYFYRALGFPELLAYYRAADIALVTPLKDGMNLVAKEYCAARTDRDGVLLLSEFAGAAEALRDGALLVNPYDVEGMAAAIERAVRMPLPEQRRRMLQMQRRICNHTVFDWMEAFLGTANQPMSGRCSAARAIG